MEQSIYHRQVCAALKFVYRAMSLDVPQELTGSSFDLTAVNSLSDFLSVSFSEEFQGTVSVFSALDGTVALQKHQPSSVSLDQDFFEYTNTGFSTSDKKQFDTLTKEWLSKNYNDKTRAAEDGLEIVRLFGSTLSVCASLPYLSLYQFTKLSAAALACANDSKEKLTLISGGFSGIQNYIYTIISKMASKSLKGRSFYLQIMADAVLQSLLDDLALNNFHKVFSSGGNFLLLAPASTAKVLYEEEFFRKVNTKIFAEHGSNLIFNLVHSTIGYRDLFTENFGNRVRDLRILTAEQKSQQPLPFLIDSTFFDVLPEGGNENSDNVKRDIITGEALRNTARELNKKQYGEDEDGVLANAKVNTVTYDQIELGRKMKKVAAVSVYKNRKVQEAVNPIGLPFSYVTQENFSNETDTYRQMIFNDPDAAKQNLGLRLVYYGGNASPVDEENEVKDFNKMAGPEGAFNRLGVLRMDADSFGENFGGNINLWQYAQMSQMSDLFFKGYVNKLWEREGNIRNNSSIIYAGGDDLLIVGKWDEVISFAQNIRSAFKAWTNDSKKYNLSAGIALTGIKYPIMRGVQTAGDAEDDAKDHEWNDVITKAGNVYLGDGKKNSITFLGKPMQWDTEFKLVCLLKEQLDYYLETTKNRSLIHKINKLNQEKKENAYRWQWRATYEIGRAIGRLSENGDKIKLEKMLKDWKVWSFTNTVNHPDHTIDLNTVSRKYTFFDLFAIAARWSELHYRTQNKDNYERI